MAEQIGLPKRTAQVVAAVVLGGAVVLSCAVKAWDVDRDLNARIEKAVAAAEVRQTRALDERLERLKLEWKIEWADKQLAYYTRLERTIKGQR